MDISGFDHGGFTDNFSQQTVTPPKKKQGGISGFLGGVAHAAVSPFEYLINASIVNPTKQLAADITDNKVAAANADLSTRRNLGTGDTGTDFTGGLKKFIGNSAQALLSVAAPAATSIKGGAAVGAGTGAASALTDRNSTAGDVLTGGLLGGATGGALSTVGKVLSKSGKGKSGGLSDNLTTQGQQMQGRGLGISGGNKVAGKELAPQDTERMLQTLKQEGIGTGNANSTARDLNNKLGDYGKQIADHFKTNDAPLLPDDTKKIADNFVEGLSTTDPRMLKEAGILAADLQKNVKSTKDLWEFRKTLDSKIPDSKFMDAATTNKVAALKDLRGYITKELGDVPGMENYHGLSEIKPFLGKGMRELNQPSGGIVGRVLSSGPVQKTESIIGKGLEKIGGSGTKNEPPLKVASNGDGVPPEVTDALKNSGGSVPPPDMPINPSQKVTGNPTSGSGLYTKGIIGRLIRQGTTSQAGQAALPGGEVPATPEQANNDNYAPSSALQDNTTLTTQKSADPFAPENAQEAIKSILAQGGDMKDVSAYLSNVDALQKLKEATGGGSKGLNSTASGVVADTKTGLKALQELSGKIASSNANNPLIGQLRSKNPFDTGAQDLQASVATAKQIVGKALEGGVLRKEDESKYAKLLPTMGDTDAVAGYKIQQLTNLISGRLNEYQNSLSGGSGGTDLASLGV